MTNDLISRAAAIAAMAPMLRSMISRGQAVEILTALPAAKPAQGEAVGRCKVPIGQTPLNDKLSHPMLDVFNEGSVARDQGTVSPYHGHSLEHLIHAAGWVQRDLRLALDAKAPNPPDSAGELDALVAELLHRHETEMRARGRSSIDYTTKWRQAADTLTALRAITPAEANAASASVITASV